MNAYFRDRLILVSQVLTLALNIVLWLVLAGKFGFSRDPVPLHFNVVYGVDFVGESQLVYQLPAVSLIVFLVNLYLGKLVYKQEKLFSYFLNFAHLFVQILFFIAGTTLAALN